MSRASYGEVSEHAEQRDQAEQTGLTNEQQALVKQLRGLADARQVEAQGASLPAELRFYLAGAVAFNAGDHTLAAEYFRKVLALPADQRRIAQYLGCLFIGSRVVCHEFAG